MTVSSEVNRSGPYNGNGVTTIFDYDFKIYNEAHLRVIKRSVAGAEIILVRNADYIVSGVGNPVGGQIATTVAPLAGETITVIPDVPFTQETDLENQGAYLAETVERAFDLAAMRDQQLQEQIDRAITIPASADASELAALISDVLRLSGSAEEVDTVAGIAANVVTVAGVAGNVTTVAGIAGDVSTVATIAPAVVAVAAIDDDVSTVADIAGVVPTVAAVAADVATVAGIAANVSAVAGNAVNINAVAGIEAEIIAVPAQVQAAEDAKDAAITAAAGLNLPPIVTGDAGKQLAVKADLSGFELAYPEPKRTTYTVAGAHTHTFDPAAQWAEVIYVGGGAGGGGATATTAGQASAGCGGSGGAVCKKIITTLLASASIVVGAGGVGVSGAAGTAGGASSYNDGVVSVSASGGTGGSVVAALTTPIVGAYAAGASGAGDVVIQGGHGEGPILFPATRSRTGAGGNTVFGRGGNSVFGPASGVRTGEAGQGPGAGGSGAIGQGVGGATTGGNGAPGLVIIIEHYAAYASSNAFDLGAGGVPSGGLAGKRAVFFGDSITEFSDYPARVAARLGLASAVSAGFGGCRMGAHTGTAVSVYYDPMSMYRIAANIASGNFTTLINGANALFAHNADDNRPQAAAVAAVNWSTVDFITIFFGTNDWSGEVPLGTVTDATGATFRGAINYIIETILTAKPGIQIVFVAPLWRKYSGVDADTATNGLGLKLVEYVDALKQQAERYQIPVLDLYRTSGVNRINWATFIPDGTHPGPSGDQRIADKIAGFLSAAL